MTMQIPDHATFFGQSGWEILGPQRTFDNRPEPYEVIAHPKLFDPRQFGITPIEWGTNCHKGYVHVISIDASGVQLDQLAVSDEHGKYPPINGREADSEESFGVRQYTGLALPLSFSGAIRIGRAKCDLPAPRYTRPPYTFTEVLDVHFASGALDAVYNRSQYFRDFRIRHAEDIAASGRSFLD